MKPFQEISISTKRIMEIGSLLINPDHCSPRGFPLRVRESRRFYIYEKRFVQKGSRDKTDSKEKEKGKEKGGRRRGSQIDRVCSRAFMTLFVAANCQLESATRVNYS